MLTLDKPSEADTSKFLTDKGKNISGGGPILMEMITGVPIPLVAGYSWNNSAQAIEIGLGNDQLGYSDTYAKRMW